MLTHCPFCKYDLTGLPDRHRCPECSFEFERNSELIQLEPSPPRWLRWVFVLLVVYFSLNIVFAWLKNSPALWFILSTQPLFLLCIALAIRPGRPVALVRSGDVQIIKRRELYIQYPLENVALAKWEFVDGDVSLIDAEQHELYHITKAIRWSSNAMKKLAVAINKRLEVRSEIWLNDHVAAIRATNQDQNVPPC